MLESSAARRMDPGTACGKAPKTPKTPKNKVKKARVSIDLDTMDEDFIDSKISTRKADLEDT
eukprot:5555147-Alexandrium_andersonii.AAC.1